MATPEQRRRAASYAANVSWARTPNRAERMAPAWAAREARWERLVDPDGVMDPTERAKAAASARRAYYQALSRKGNAARAARRAAA